MSDIPSANQKIQIEPTQYRSPTSESLFQTIGGSVNYALDGVATNAADIVTINSDIAALDSRMDAIKYPQLSTLAISDVGGTLSSGNDTSLFAIPAGESWYTVLLDPNAYSATRPGFLMVYLSGTIFSAQQVLQISVQEIMDYWVATGLQSGASVSFFVPQSSTSFPSGTSMAIRCWNTNTTVDYRVIRRTTIPTQGI